MSNPIDWREVWEQKSSEQVSDFELDRGRLSLDLEAEKLSEQELLDFIEPKESETILDAGCGTGVNILRLHSRVKNIIGIDCAHGSLERCQRRFRAHNVANARIYLGSVTSIPLPDHSVNKVLSLSVFQYLNDEEVRKTLKEFVRVLLPDGIIILHVKNLSSLYWSTLWLAKKLKTLFRMKPRIEYFRPFDWYFKELQQLNCTILDYDSFNVLMIDRMPQRMVTYIRRLELRHHRSPFLRKKFMRRHGAELMIKARIGPRLTQD